MEFLLSNISNISNIGNAIGWTLIHFLWQGFLLFISYWFITRIFLQNKIHLQYWVGMLFIALCLIIPIRELVIQLGSNNDINIIQQLSITVGFIAANGILTSLDMFIAGMQKIIPFLVVFWLICVLLISSHLVKSWIVLIRLSKQSGVNIPENLVNKLDIYAKKLKLKFKPIIIIKQKIDIPATFGFLKPIVLLPTSLINRLPTEQMEAILLHELCHIKRADFLHNILQLLVETLFFYHPLTRWISRDVRKIREQCCDELVLELNADPLVYAKALTNIASIYNNFSQNKQPPSQIQIAANDGELLNRIKLLMLEKKSKTPMLNIGMSIFLSILILLMFNNLINNTEVNTTTSSNIQQAQSFYPQTNKMDKPEYSPPSINTLPSHNAAPQAMPKEPKVAAKNVTNSKTVTAKQVTDNYNDTAAQTITNIKPADKIIADYQQTNIADTIATNKESTPINNKAIINHNQNLNIPTNNTFPKVIKKVNPEYKVSIRAKGIEGNVILSFNINQKGLIKNITVDKSSPHKLLDRSAIKALKKWRFDPNTITDNNLANRYQQIFSFTLDNNQEVCQYTDTGTRISRKTLCSKN
ncbi:MAG: TonB family protein [Proteobacteria bacterium]|nr:TonB family protein [Pseudomonadota bacterium]